jgi:thiamine pyrophosphokinase
MARLIIFANGLVPNLESARHLIQPGDILYAADGGTRHALALGLLPSVVIGDLDSLMPEDRKALDARDVDVRRFPRDKDKTDLELALNIASKSGQCQIIVIGALGGRLDQTLANLSLLSGFVVETNDIRLDDGVEEAFFTRDRCEIHGRPGDIVSLLPWGAEVTGIYTEGLRWPLQNEALIPDTTRGVSNEMRGETASVKVGAGLLLIIHRRVG